MKRILITGAGSYIGENVEQYLKSSNDSFTVDTIDVKNDSWREISFAVYDVIFHVAGIAHADVGNMTEEKKNLYYSINTNLVVDIAKKAKADGVKQFIFMSSMIVYSGCKERIIDRNTQPKPNNVYGDSKWQADKKICELMDDFFKVAVLRPPMIYGKGCKGNYVKLSRLARKTPIFPKIKNIRSMLYIGNLCEFVRIIICDEASGIFFPQNKEYSVTSEIVRTIALYKGKKILLLPGFNILARVVMKMQNRVGLITQKVFGDFAYDMDMSEYDHDYRIFTLEESIHLTEE